MGTLINFLPSTIFSKGRKELKEMAASKLCPSALCSICFHILLLIFLQLAVSCSSVRFLPGFQGPLPFELETGYVGVDESEDVHLFYYFVKSENDPAKDPIILWLTGGPGCSAISTLMFEIGPVKLNIVEYDGSLPTLVLNPNSWTNMSSILFVDLPVGTGYSYARSPLAAKSGDFKQNQHALHFLRKWLIDHPEFIFNAVYIGGESYSGITVPLLVQSISNGNDDGIKPLINLQGYLLGNAFTDPVLDGNSRIPFAHGMGLISDELYQLLKSSCNREYIHPDPRDADCLKAMEVYNECISGIESSNILERHCGISSPKPREMFSERRFLDNEPPVTLGCRSYGYLLSYYWANDEKVQEALHIQKGSIEEWHRCNYELPYAHEIQSSFQYHVNLSMKGYRSLIYRFHSWHSSMDKIVKLLYY